MLFQKSLNFEYEQMFFKTYKTKITKAINPAFTNKYI